MLSAKRSPVFAGQGLHNAPRRAYKLRASASTTRCQRSARGTVLMEPTVKPHLHKHSLQPATQLKPLVRQPVRQKYHTPDSPAKVRQKQSGTADMQHMVKAAPAKGRHVAKQAVNAGASASETVQQLVPNKAFPFIKQTGHHKAEGLHKPIGLVLASAYLLGIVCHLSGIPTSVLHGLSIHKSLTHASNLCTLYAGIEAGPNWMPAMMGATVGSLYAALNRAGMRKFWRAPTTQLNVVITGASKGVGKAIAREFLRHVSVCSMQLVQVTAARLCLTKWIANLSWQ